MKTKSKTGTWYVIVNDLFFFIKIPEKDSQQLGSVQSIYEISMYMSIYMYSRSVFAGLQDSSKINTNLPISKWTVNISAMLPCK